MVAGNSPESDFNDRTPEPPEGALPKPHIEIIVDGNKIYKPGMRTYFVEDNGLDASIISNPNGSGVYTEEVCSCNTVVVYSYDEVSDFPQGYEPSYVCSCDSECVCESFCSCDSDCSCDSYSSGGGMVSCGSPCACVPVH
jgi:hypothetical protein